MRCIQIFVNLLFVVMYSEMFGTRLSLISDDIVNCIQLPMNLSVDVNASVNLFERHFFRLHHRKLSSDHHYGRSHLNIRYFHIVADDRHKFR